MSDKEPKDYEVECGHWLLLSSYAETEWNGQRVQIQPNAKGLNFLIGNRISITFSYEQFFKQFDKILNEANENWREELKKEEDE